MDDVTESPVDSDTEAVRRIVGRVRTRRRRQAAGTAVAGVVAVCGLLGLAVAQQDADEPVQVTDSGLAVADGPSGTEAPTTTDDAALPPASTTETTAPAVPTTSEADAPDDLPGPTLPEDEEPPDTSPPTTRPPATEPQGSPAVERVQVRWTEVEGIAARTLRLTLPCQYAWPERIIDVEVSEQADQIVVDVFASIPAGAGPCDGQVQTTDVHLDSDVAGRPITQSSRPLPPPG